MNNKEATIVRVATQLFSVHGYHSVGVDTIISKSKVAKMTFYKYFPSKDALIETVLRERNNMIQSSILSQLQTKKTPQGRIKAILDWHEQWFTSSDFHGCLFIKATDEYPEEDSRMRKVSKEYKTWLTSLLASNLKDMGCKNCTDLSSFIVYVLDGLTVNCNLSDKSHRPNVKFSWKQINSLIHMHDSR